MIFCQIGWKIKSLLHHQASVQSANTPLMPAVMDIKNIRSSRERKHTFKHIMTCWEASCCKKKGKQYKSLMLWWVEWPFFSYLEYDAVRVSTSGCNPACSIRQTEHSHVVLFMKYLKWENIDFLFAAGTMGKILASLNFRDTLGSMVFVC